MTKEEKIRKRLGELIYRACAEFAIPAVDRLAFSERAKERRDIVRDCTDAIMREFALRPVSQGRVDSETGEVT